MDDPSDQARSTPGEPLAGEPAQLLSLVASTALVLLAALALPVLGQLVSRETAVATAPQNAGAVVGVVAAAWLLLAYPLWPGVLLGEGDPVARFWRWLLLRLAEVAIVLAVATPMLLAGTVFSGRPLDRVGHVVAGLSGAAAAAVAYRLVHRSCGDRLRAVAVLDAVCFLFAPLVVGYLLLEFYGVSIGWCWLISPLALAAHLSADGLRAGGAAFWVGVVGYTSLAALGLLCARPLARRFRARQSRFDAAQPF